MKYGTNHKPCRSAGWLASLIVAAFLLPLSNVFADDIEEIKETALIVNIEDPYGLFSPEAEWVQEDLLEQAFYDAADRAKLDGFETMYNRIVPKNARSYVDFRVISWRRSIGNMYEFTAAATYYNADGDENKLGVFRGYRSGVGVLMRRDVGDHFLDSAEDAFYDALKTLKKKLS